MTGTLLYDWAAAAYKVQLDVEGYEELFQYNAQKGETIPAVLDQFAYDTASGTAKICGSCQRKANPTVMPPLGFLPGAAVPYSTKWANQGKGTGQGCTLFNFTGTVASEAQVTTVELTATGSPCKMTYRDGRVLTFGPSSTPATAPSFVPPTDCKCRSRLDLILEIDTSCSIEFAFLPSHPSDLIASFPPQ